MTKIKTVLTGRNYNLYFQILKSQKRHLLEKTMRIQILYRHFLWIWLEILMAHIARRRAVFIAEPSWLIHLKDPYYRKFLLKWLFIPNILNDFSPNPMQTGFILSLKEKHNHAYIRSQGGAEARSAPFATYAPSAVGTSYNAKINPVWPGSLCARRVLIM